MKTLKTLFLAALLTPLVSFNNAAPDCSIMEEGTFTYLDVPSDPTAYIEIKNKRHTEYHQKGKYEIKSRIEWISACSYEVTLRKSENPDLDFDRGTTMRVTIEDTMGRTIYYKATMNGKTWHGKLQKTS